MSEALAQFFCNLVIETFYTAGLGIQLLVLHDREEKLGVDQVRLASGSCVGNGVVVGVLVELSDDLSVLLSILLDKTTPVKPNSDLLVILAIAWGPAAFVGRSAFDMLLDGSKQTSFGL